MNERPLPLPPKSIQQPRVEAADGASTASFIALGASMLLFLGVLANAIRKRKGLHHAVPSPFGSTDDSGDSENECEQLPQGLLSAQPTKGPRAAREAPAGAPLSKKTIAEALKLTTGRVRVHGLLSGSEHNGKEGLVMGKSAPADASAPVRWNVRMDDGQHLSLKPSNLQLLPSGRVEPSVTKRPAL